MNFLPWFGATGKDGQEEARQFLQVIRQLYEELAEKHNSKTAAGDVRLTVVAVPVEPIRAKDAPFARFMVHSSEWALLVSARTNAVLLFLFPMSEVANRELIETPSRLRLSITYDKRQTAWTVDGMPVDAGELNTLLRTMLKDIVLKSKKELKKGDEPLSWIKEAPSLVTTVRELLSEKQALAQKIVFQQEALQRRIASDIHDVVLTELLLLKRSLTGSTPPAPEAVARTVDSVHRQLREICADLAPRDLSDCGLAVVLDDLTGSFGLRHNIDAVFEGDPLPDLPDEVVLHAYRIVQEALNNVVKHSAATRVRVATEIADGILRLSIHDNGKGLSANIKDGSESGGQGMSILQERTALINEQLPAKLTVEDRDGTWVTLFIQMPKSEAES